MLEQPTSSPAPLILEPKSLKVFGILHLIFATLGLLSALVAMPMLLAMEPLLGLLKELVVKSEDAEVIAILDVVGEFYLSQRVIYLVLTLVGLVGSILLLRGGLALVKKRKEARKSSNLWCWFFVVLTIVNIPFTFLYSLPAQKKLEVQIEEKLGSSSASAAPLSSDLEALITSGTTVLTAVISLLYPGLALFFLNRQKVKDYLTQQGT